MYYLHKPVDYFVSMTNKKKNIDRGKFLKSLVEKNGISIVKLVKKVGYKDRASYYAHIEKSDLSFDILMAYAKALNYDLKDDFPEVVPFLMEEPPATYNVVPNNLEESLKLLELWKQKYYILLEKYTRVIEEKLV